MWLVTGIPYWRERLTTMLRHSRGRVPEPFIAPRKRRAIAREARCYVLLYFVVIAASVVVGSWAIALYWLVPALLGQPALRLFLLAEHGNCPPVADMLKNSRTTRSNALVRWFAWNMPYHAEHHAFPAIPFHALPALHAQCKPKPPHRVAGYAAFHQEAIRRSLQRG